MPVPFGFGVGDFIAFGTLVLKVYTAYESAPKQFQNFSKEILSLHVVVRQVEDQLSISGSGGTARLPGSRGIASLITKYNDDLKVLCDELRTIMEELDDLLKRYQNLASNCRNPIGRFRWGQEDLVGLRERLRSGITLLNTINGGLAKYVLSNLTNTDFASVKIFLHLPSTYSNICDLVSW